MPVDPDQKHLHSAEYFGEQRDFWWNHDFLALMAQRLDLPSAKRILDVGSGLGHWTRALMPHLAPDARITGIDREPAWVQGATAAAAAKGWSDRVQYLLADAEKLPFPDDQFDLVTCQTVLIHVRDARAVLREMVRVLRPGGRLLTVEPNNLASVAIQASRGARDELEDNLRILRFHAICERGKEALGEGYNSLGDRLPALYLALGMEQLQIYQSDHAYPLTPPYNTPAQRALAAQLAEWDGMFYGWNQATARRYFLAGGGPEDEFPALWTLGTSLLRREIQAIANQTYHDAGGSIVYLISALKPDPEINTPRPSSASQA